MVYADTTSSKESSIEELYLNSISKIQETRNLMRIPLKENEFLDWNENENLNLDLESNWKKKDFEDAVLSAKEYIRKGDIFQIVISQRFQTQVNNDPFNLYRSLRMVNPSPYMSFFDFGSWYLIGSSPEVMVKAKINKNGEIVASLRPIAGTRPRGIDNQQDLELEKELLKDPKEIAEHVMLIDLGRNDLGRVCEMGTVKVKDLMVVEKYSHVMHIVSEVEGILKNNADVWDLLKASFPAGTVTGAPKVVIHPQCHGILSEVGLCVNPIDKREHIYSYKIGPNGEVLGDDPVDRYNHAWEAFGRGVYWNFGAVGTVCRGKKRKFRSQFFINFFKIGVFKIFHKFCILFFI